MSDRSRIGRALNAPDASGTDERWNLADAWPFLAAVVVLLAVVGALHGWLAGQPGEWVFAVDLAVAVALVVVGALAWVLENRRRRLAATLRQVRRELDRQLARDVENQRLSLLGALAAGLAHELGQPLSVARVGIEGIHYLRQLGRAPDPEQLEKTLSRVGMSLMAMTQTIDHLRSLAAPQGAGTGAIDVVAVTSAVLRDRDQWLRYSEVAIDWASPSQPVMALAEPAGLRLILVNLLRNAVEAVAAQGEERRLVRVSVGPGSVLTVHDSGPGIPPERLTTIFDPFQSTKGGAGRGIGLSLALASARRMGGDLDVISQPGSGTVFTLRLLPAPTAQPERS